MQTGRFSQARASEMSHTSGQRRARDDRCCWDCSPWAVSSFCMRTSRSRGPRTGFLLCNRAGRANRHRSLCRPTVGALTGIRSLTADTTTYQEVSKEDGEYDTDKQESRGRNKRRRARKRIAMV
ncbi:hypothetical protein G7K_5719-t1 [Saitoella complicata NRRL Y-17804]|uniref:Uncharacterized protein n=1 Tax=Saitoella complicata (strain BCRC 22490 / CBS 7301 / JCM 7358 / NBRC 10748 / NRRL Y-17804) TaxID=698492 RepID=A0A0E9NP93_SAICN|nr:hypothetical protein G7K_5719-t1 [Saitoella complicata NRRL Y-17804]